MFMLVINISFCKLRDLGSIFFWQCNSNPQWSRQKCQSLFFMLAHVVFNWLCFRTWVQDRGSSLLLSLTCIVVKASFTLRATYKNMSWIEGVDKTTHVQQPKVTDYKIWQKEGNIFLEREREREREEDYAHVIKGLKKPFFFFWLNKGLKKLILAFVVFDIKTLCWVRS